MPPRRTRSTRASKSQRYEVEALPTERKFVTLLRADIVQSTPTAIAMELEASVTWLASIVDAMRSAVRDHGGAVCREAGDGFTAVFGAPIADDRHATNACHAAIEVVSRVAALPANQAEVRVGIHSGYVVAGVLQGDFAAAYELSGPPLFLVDRLQRAADPSGIIVSEETRKLVDSSIGFEPLGKRALQGFPEPVAIVRITGIQTTRDSTHWGSIGTAGFVGREAEHARMTAAAEAALAGRGGMVTIVGDPGVGKSRLAREATGTLRARSWTQIACECNTILGRSPFALLRDLMNQLLAPSDPQASETLGHLPAEQRAAIDVLLDRPYDNATWSAIGQRRRSRLLIDAALAVLEARARRGPVVILIEDLQWGDDASSPALAAMATLARTCSVLMLVTARSNSMPVWVADHPAVQIKLEPLDDRGARSLLDHLLGPSPGLAPLKQRVLDHTGRLPLFVIETCHRLAELGTVAGNPGNFHLVHLPAVLDVPTTVHGVIAARIDRLSADDKTLLQTAAAIGSRVPLRLLATVADMPARALAKCRDNLEAAALLLPASDVGAAAFPHDLIRQVAYDALLIPSKIGLHGRILSALEAGVTDGIADLPGALVHHAELARNWARAADHAEHVAKICLTQGGLAESSGYFQRAILAVDKLEPGTDRETRAIDLRIDARSAVSNSGQLTRWLELAKEAETRALRLNDKVRLTSAMITRAAALNFLGPVSEAVLTGEDVLKRALALHDEGRIAMAEFGLGQGATQAGEYRRAIALLVSARRRFVIGNARFTEETRHAHLPFLCSFMLVLCHFALGETDAVVAHHRDIEESVRDTGRPLGTFAREFCRGLLLTMRADLNAAEPILERALSIARQNELLLFVPLASFHLGLVQFRKGHLAKAAVAFQEAMSESGSLGVQSINLRARLYVHLTVPSTALSADGGQEMKAVHDTAQQQGYRAIAAEALVVQGAMMLRTEVDTDKASVYLRHGWRMATELDAVPLSAWALEMLGEVA